MIMLKDDETGQIQIADDVIATISNTAAFEVEGVVSQEGNFSGGIAEILGKRNLTKGVKIDVEDNKVKISINLSVKFGYKLAEVADNVQKKIKSLVETMTGLNVTQIDINVVGISFAREKTKKKNES